jgi:hypothetical protein
MNDNIFYEFFHKHKTYHKSLIISYIIFYTSQHYESL